MFLFPPERIINLFLIGFYNSLKRKILRLNILNFKLNKNKKQKKSDIYIIHHLACTGGSLISKIIRDNFNCILVSEINPGYAFGTYSFTPHNLLSQFSYSSKKPLKTFRKAIEIYNSCIDFCLRNIEENQFLVIRDWSEGDFYVDKILPHNCSSREWIDAKKYSINSIVTVRHPIESFISKVKNNWENIDNKNALEIYCRRYLDFLNHYEGSEIIYYENICSNYESEFIKISKIWGQKIKKVKLPSSKKISGDSGRSSLKISLRPSKNINKEIKNQMKDSISYINLCNKLGYNPYIKGNTKDFFVEAKL